LYIGQDAIDLAGIGHDESGRHLVRWDGPKPGSGHRRPQRRYLAVDHHRRSVTRTLEIDRLEILLGIEADTITT